MKRFLKQNTPYIVLVLALTATLGSLYFSEIMQLVPCILCWYQRICMYPLIAISALGIYTKDKNLPYYVLALSIPGLLIAIYHNLLYYHILPESIAPCVSGVSCTTKLIEWFGFITIPLMSLVAFALITTFMIIYLKLKK